MESLSGKFFLASLGAGGFGKEDRKGLSTQLSYLLVLFSVHRLCFSASPSKCCPSLFRAINQAGIDVLKTRFSLRSVRTTKVKKTILAGILRRNDYRVAVRKRSRLKPKGCAGGK